MNCTHCGSRLAENEKFCSVCGTPVSAPAPAPAPAVSLDRMGLYITAGPGVGRSFSLGEATRIGRGAGNEVRLFDPEVSREHAAIYRYDQGFAVNDLGSANGTFVNDRRITEAVWVQPGDTIRIGTVYIQVTAPGISVGKRPAPPAGHESRSAQSRSAEGGLPGWFLWALMGFGMLLAAAGVVGLISVLGA
jgi:pSer/pThr/pTyr-binding forkhead associated (FHA) protein